MFRRRRSTEVVYTIGLLALLLSGCGDNGWGRRKALPPEPEPRPLPVPHAVLGDTIGAHTLVGAGELQHLRGFGLVIGLGDSGGSDCPSTIREYLLDQLTRAFASPDPGERKPDFSPQEMIDSLDTAVVAVHGLVPAGARQGTPFDLQVQAIDTQTRSLEGGVLVLCELRHFDVASSGKGLVSGRALARGHGLVYTSAFAGADPSAAQQAVRRGYVLGGGKTLLDRTVRLLLQEPSYWMARKIERRINERFGQDPPVAHAMSRGYLTLTTPPRYADDPARFIELVTHLYLENAPGLVERKLSELSRQLDGPEGTLNHISLVWEGLGRTAIPHLQPLYTHADPAVRFYAARAGLRLQDVNALTPMGQIAESPEHPCRLLAVSELGECDYRQASRQLVRLLDSDDDEVRVKAYEGLLKHKHPAVKTQRFSSMLDPTQVSLALDVVESNGRPLVYVQRMLEPRIAVFGAQMPLSLPLFYNHPDDWVTLNALDEQSDIAILCRTRSGRLMSEPLMVPARVVELIRALADLPVKDDAGHVQGIGLDYARVVEVLDALCTSGAIPARLAVQTTGGVDLLGPAELPERPEGDEPSLLTDQPQAAGAGAARTATGTDDPDWQRPE
jgi:hypothetical protein